MKKFIIFIVTIFFVINIHSAEPIANVPDNGVITRQEVIWYYTMKIKRWSDGSKVKIVALPDDDPLHADFVRSVLGLTVAQYTKLLDYSINSGQGGTLIRVKTVEEMVVTVENTPYALGYISKDYLILRGLDKDVKILRITD